MRQAPEPIEKPIPAGPASRATGLPTAPPGVVPPAPEGGTTPEDRGATDHPRGSGPNDAGPRTTDAADAAERRRRALASQRSPVPHRGAVPPAAVPGAERCILVLRRQFALRVAGSGRAPADADIHTTLANAGLTGITVRPGSSFAASTGEVCILGAFTAGEPAFTIGAFADDRSCPP